MAHIFYIDPLEKLNFKKDSSLFLALTLQQLKQEVVLLFENDFVFTNQAHWKVPVHRFHGRFVSDSFYLKEFSLQNSGQHTFSANDIFHFRLDPPFDARYLRYLWMADALKDIGVKVINDPRGIATNSEKILAYRNKNSHPSYVGASLSGIIEFVEQLRLHGHRDLILKPLDLYQGYGVTKESILAGNEKWREVFQRMVETYKGPVVAQPFIEKVASGEIRSTFWQGKELASILKVPPAGSYLANIAQGASYKLVSLPQGIKTTCEEVSAQLLKEGVPWVAFDLLDERLSEVNITCPGLLVECALASGKNLALQVAQDLGA